MGARSKSPTPPAGCAKFPVSEVATKKAERLANWSSGDVAAVGWRQSGTVSEPHEQSGASRRRIRSASAAA
jgi:hypothetical protein